MSPVVRVNDGTFADLSTLKTWFGTKTPSETIDRLVQEAMEQLGMERDDQPEEATPAGSDEPMQFDTAPGLAFTKPLVASVNGKLIHSPRWSAILLAMIAQVKAKGVKGESLVRELAVPAKADYYEDEGFKYHRDLGISVQGQSAPDCWKEVDRLAKKWRIPVAVEFMWRQNPKAQYPGKTGVLRSGNA
ncbi:T4SS efffector SepA family protein [Sinorhizobium fredii]|uniref:T4SS efffector SepA family protein n=1 Tax=Rhizobium fredii TaxID=380 RepID=UPI003511D341